MMKMLGLDEDNIKKVFFDFFYLFFTRDATVFFFFTL